MFMFGAQLMGSLPSLSSFPLSIPSQLDTTHERAVVAERSKGEAETMVVELQVRIAQLEQQLEEEGVKGGIVGELQEQVKVMEEQLARLQTEVGTFCSEIWVMCILME